MGKLTKSHKSALRKSSREGLEVTFRILKRHFLNDKWVGTNNQYRRNCIKTLKRHIVSANVNNGHLSQYIAASAPLHCTDGWGYLGRALECHAQGDSNAARHLAYYAELRAAMSLLSAEGIGIFNDRHFVVDNSGACLPINPPPPANLSARGGPGTHVIAWEALEHWSGLKRSTDLLTEIIKPGRKSLKTWVFEFSPGSSWQLIGKEWLKSWGLDLARLGNDQIARNAASYRPSHLTLTPTLSARSASQFLYNVWELCDPTMQSPFELLDRHLLRISLEQQFLSLTGQKPRDNISEFRRRISLMLTAMGISGYYSQELKRFLTRAVSPSDPPLIIESQGTVTAANPRHHIQVISRAALLLRVATGACSRLLREADVKSTELKFWWKSLGQERGFWKPGQEPADFRDLWSDIALAGATTQQWKRDKRGAEDSYARWLTDCSREITVLGGCERIAIWGLSL